VSTAPLVVSLCLNNPPCIGFTLEKSHIKNIRRREKGDCRCKMTGTRFHSVVTNRAQMCTADWYKENNLTGECHSQESNFVSRLPRDYSCCGILRYTCERFAKRLFLSWHTTVLEHGLLQKGEIQYQPFYIDSSPVRDTVPL
jgi:hypothetical protein